MRYRLLKRTLEPHYRGCLSLPPVPQLHALGQQHSAPFSTATTSATVHLGDSETHRKPHLQRSPVPATATRAARP